MMISGALLLGKIESYNTIITKRILRFVVVLIVATTMIWILYKPFDLKALCIGIIKGNIQGSYWYLYSYLGMLVSLPFIRKIATKLSKDDLFYLLSVHFVFVSLIPCLNVGFSKYGFSIQTSPNFNLAILVESSIFYPLIGYFLHNMDIDIIKKKYYAIAICLSVWAIILESLFTIWEAKQTGTYTQHYVMLFDWVLAIITFIVVRRLVSGIIIEKNVQA